MLVINRFKRESFIMLFASALFLVIGAFILWHKVSNRPFNADFFHEQQTFWRENLDFPPLQEQAQALETSLFHLSHAEFIQQLNYLQQSIPSSNLRYLYSSRSEIKAMAQAILDSLAQKNPEHTFKFLDSVHARDAVISLLLDEPLTYLFILSQEDEDATTLFLSVQPDRNGGFQIEEIGQFSTNEPSPADFLANLFALYHQQIR